MVTKDPQFGFGNQMAAYKNSPVIDTSSSSSEYQGVTSSGTGGGSYINPFNAGMSNSDPIAKAKYSQPIESASSTQKATDGFNTPEYKEMQGLQVAQLKSEQKNLPYYRVGAGVFAGMQAAGQIKPTTSMKDNVIQTVGAGVAGAAAGSAGGPWGALAGGIAGLVAGGLSAYMGSKAKSEENRAIEKKNREIKALNDRAYRDEQSNLAYSRIQASKTDRYNRNENRLNRLERLEANEYTKEQNALTREENAEMRDQAQANTDRSFTEAQNITRAKSLWDSYDRGRQNLNDMIASNKQLKEYFIQRGR